jgi:hypothetical protein
MTAKKVIIIAALIIGVFLIYIFTLPIITIKSETSQWRVAFVNYDINGVDLWDGFLIYDGKSKVENISTQLNYNGKLFTSDADSCNLETAKNVVPTKECIAFLMVNPNKKAFFPIVTFADKPKNGELIIKYFVDGKPFTETIKWDRT